MKKITKILSIVLVAAVLFSMALTANAYTYKETGKTSTQLTTNASGTTYVYDFKAADGSYMPISDFCGHNGNKSSHANDANGYKFVSTTGGGSGVNTKGMIHDFYIADPDFCIGHTANTKFKAQAGHYYVINVEWMCANANKRIFLVSNYGSSDFTGNSCVLQQSSNSSVANQRITTSFVLDGDATYTISGESISMNGKYIGFASNSGTYYFYKITVTVYDKEAFTVADKQLTINFDNGFKDIYVPRVDVNGAGTLEIAQDPNNTGRGNVLKMTTTKASGTTFQFGLAVKPGLGNYKAAINNQLPGVDGYQVTLGNSYRVSYDVYCEDYDEGISDTYACFLSTEAGIGAVGGKDSQTKLNYKNAGISTLQNGAGNGKWIHVEYTIKATSANNGTYLLIGLGGTKPNTASGTEDYAAIVYFDNIVVTDVTNAPQNYAAESKRSIRAESGTGENYVSAGLRFKAEIPTATANAAEEIGFIVAPEKHVTDYGANWYDMTSGTPAMSTAKVAKCTNTLYGVNGSNNQYQLLLSKLTQENENADLKDTYFTVLLYVKAADGTYTYYNVATTSYREVVNAYISKDASNASKY